METENPTIFWKAWNRCNGKLKVSWMRYKNFQPFLLEILSSFDLQSHTTESLTQLLLQFYNADSESQVKVLKLVASNILNEKASFVEKDERSTGELYRQQLVAKRLKAIRTRIPRNRVTYLARRNLLRFRRSFVLSVQLSNLLGGAQLVSGFHRLLINI